MRKSIAAVALSTAALTLAAPTTANAEMYGVDDIRDTHHGSDILALSVRNGPHNLNVTTYHENLRRDPASGSAESIFVDTDRSNPGPEYVFVAGLYEGTDYVLHHTDGFRPATWGKPVENGDYIMRIDYAKDVVKVRISRAALGDADAVRVAARASGTRADGTHDGLVDWVGPRRWFTPWIDKA